jgi:hypothetical protein
MPVQAPPVDPANFRELFRHHAGGVVVIGLDAHPVGHASD